MIMTKEEIFNQWAKNQKVVKRTEKFIFSEIEFDKDGNITECKTKVF